MLFYEESKRFCEAFPKVFTKEINDSIFQRPIDSWFYWIKYDHDASKFVKSLWIEDKKKLLAWISKNTTLICSHIPADCEITDFECDRIKHMFKRENLSLVMDKRWVDIALFLWEKGEQDVRYVLKNANQRISCTLQLLM